MRQRIDLDDLSPGDSGLDLSEIPLDTDWAESADAASLSKFLRLVSIYEQRLADAGTAKWFAPGSLFSIENCPKHRAFFDAGAHYKERMFMASNRTGKSVAGAFEAACHATGIYPDWWKGHRFDKPVQIWAAGSDAKSTRNTAQKELLGPTGAWGTGMIPKELLGQYWALHGTPQAVDLIEVKHISGGKSTIGFKNYKQELPSWMGTAMDFIWFDEEVPADIYNEALIRTMTTKGLIVETFTPLAGLTPLVVKFCSDADFLCGAAPIVATIKNDDGEGEDARLAGVKRYKAVVQAGWDDAPWLDEETKLQMLADTPEHLKDARSKGYPAMGSGNIYPFPPERVFVDPIHIPENWPRLFALDVGWNVTAASWAAWDEVSDTIWVYDEYYGDMGSKGEDSGPEYHIAQILRRGSTIPGVIDPSARQRSQIDGRKLMQIYKEGGLMLWPADNEVEGGIANISSRIQRSKFKVFRHLENSRKEYMLYRRAENGKPLKENDHLMDTWRYLANNIRRAMPKNYFIGGGSTYNGTKRYDI